MVLIIEKFYYRDMEAKHELIHIYNIPWRFKYYIVCIV